MIISCPECTGPFELADDHIAALVQIECPHCQFRMILDFAAANDASLREEGMRMASGYRSVAEYRRAVGTAAPIAEPRVPERKAPEIEPAAERPRPEPARVPEPARAPAAAKPTPARIAPPTSPAVASPTTRPRVAPRPEPTADAEAEASGRRVRRDTVLGPLHKRPTHLPPSEPHVELDYEDEPPTVVRSAAELDLALHPGSARAGTGAASRGTEPPVPSAAQSGSRTVPAPGAPPARSSSTTLPAAGRPAAPLFTPPPSPAGPSPTFQPPTAPPLGTFTPPPSSATVPAPGGVPAHAGGPPGRATEAPRIPPATPPGPSLAPPAGSSSVTIPATGPAPAPLPTPSPSATAIARGLDTQLTRPERLPPHTPAPPPSTSRGTESGPVSVPAELDTSGELDRPRRRTSAFAVTILVLLVLLAVGLVASSAALKGTPDPRPLVEDLLRQFVKQSPG